jgi:hypothetical protein
MLSLPVVRCTHDCVPSRWIASAGRGLQNRTDWAEGDATKHSQGKITQIDKFPSGAQSAQAAISNREVDGSTRGCFGLAVRRRSGVAQRPGRH